jgi:DNA-directed RNA polymerase subunit RPC12/RpoP
MNEQQPEVIILKLGGKTYRCTQCGSNVFTRLLEHNYNVSDNELVYRCNGCGDVIAGSKGEKNDPS